MVLLGMAIPVSHGRGPEHFQNNHTPPLHLSFLSQTTNYHTHSLCSQARQSRTKQTPCTTTIMLYHETQTIQAQDNTTSTNNQSQTANNIIHLPLLAPPLPSWLLHRMPASLRSCTAQDSPSSSFPRLSHYEFNRPKHFHLRFRLVPYRDRYGSQLHYVWRPGSLRRPETFRRRRLRHWTVRFEGRRTRKIRVQVSHRQWIKSYNKNSKQSPRTWFANPAPVPAALEQGCQRRYGNADNGNELHPSLGWRQKCQNSTN